MIYNRINPKFDVFGLNALDAAECLGYEVWMDSKGNMYFNNVADDNESCKREVSALIPELFRDYSYYHSLIKRG